MERLSWQCGGSGQAVAQCPYSIPEWAYGIGELDHLMRVKGYTCIRWVSVANEPGHDNFSWWQDSDMKSVPFSPSLKAVREEFDRRGLVVPISAPDGPTCRNSSTEVDFDNYVGAYDLHSYNAVFDSMPGEYNLTEAERRMSQWAEWAHARNKTFFIFQSLAPWPMEGAALGADRLLYQSGLKNASLVVRGINAGVDGFNRWSFTNRGDLDGQWQFVRAWDAGRDKLLDTFAPQPNSYYLFAMLSRYLPKYAEVLASRVDAPYLEEDRKLVAAALRCKGNLRRLS